MGDTYFRVDLDDGIRGYLFKHWGSLPLWRRLSMAETIVFFIDVAKNEREKDGDSIEHSLPEPNPTDKDKE